MTSIIHTSTRRVGPTGLAAVALGLALLLPVPPSSAQQGEHWVGTWTVASVGRPQVRSAAGRARRGSGGPGPAGTDSASAPVPFMHFNNQTLRQIVRTSIGGRRVRVVLSNAFGTSPLTIGAAHVAVRDVGSAIVPASDRALTFSGRPTMTMPSGAVVFSDPVDLAVAPMSDLAIDLYVPGNTNTPSPLTFFRRGTADELRLRNRQSRRNVGLPRCRHHPELVPRLASRGDGAGSVGRDRDRGRLDHRGFTLDAGYQQPLPESPGPAPVGLAVTDGRAQCRHRGQSRAE